jgi:tetratricopeptide (TPR) repeat protein
MILVTFAMAGCASHKSHPRPTTVPLASTKSAKKPTTQSLVTAQRVATAPTTQPATLPVAMVATSEPASQPATQAVAEQPSEPPFNPAPPTTNPAEMEADAALAERIAGLAQSALPTKVPSNDLWEPILQQMAAMLSAANKLDPTNARISRLGLDANLRLHDDDGAIAALNAIRRADPADQFAQIQLIDLYAGRMETAVAKVAYFKYLMSEVTAVPPAVRSHTGVECARLLLERGETQTAKSLLHEALVLNPLNGEALRLHYDMLPPNTSSFERVAGLLAILKSNPSQTRSPAEPGDLYYAAQLGDQLAANGLAEDAIAWYRAALALSMSGGYPDLNSARACAVQMLLNDQADGAAGLAAQLIKVEPNNPDNWFLDLAILRFAGAKDDYAKALPQAANVMANGLIEILNQIAAPGTQKATTRPITDDTALTLPDLALTVAQLNQTGDAQLKAKFVEAVSDLAMVEIYFAQQADAAPKLLDALGAILPADSPQVIRLSGWTDLVAGRTAQARTKLATIAARDPLAELGLIKLTAMDPANQHTAANSGRQLISQHPSGLLAAIIWDGLRGLDVKIVTSGQSDLVKQEIDAFPKDWLKILNQPQGFYALHVEPVNVSLQFGEPLLATVSILNLTDSDLTIGPDGVIKPGMWFGAQVHGATDQNLGGVAYDQIAGPLVLPARQHISQVIRLDQGQLLGILNSDPTVSMEVYGTILTNPTAGASGSLVPGPAGYSVRFATVFDRKATPPGGPDSQQAATDLTDGTSIQKIRAIELLAKYIQLIAASKDATDQTKQFQAVCYQSIFKARNDSSPAVSAWAEYTIGSMSAPQARSAAMSEMTDDPDWRFGDAQGNRLHALGRSRAVRPRFCQGGAEPSGRCRHASAHHRAGKCAGNAAGLDLAAGQAVKAG